MEVDVMAGMMIMLSLYTHGCMRLKFVACPLPNIMHRGSRYPVILTKNVGFARMSRILNADVPSLTNHAIHQINFWATTVVYHFILDLCQFLSQAPGTDMFSIDRRLIRDASNPRLPSSTPQSHDI
jgi:hypothetical protein